jgi:hypothetical protein
MPKMRTIGNPCIKGLLAGLLDVAEPCKRAKSGV